MPYPQPNQLVMIWSKLHGNRNPVSPADFLDWKRQNTPFLEMAAFTSQDYNLSSTQQPQYIQGERVSTNWYRLLGERVWMGRDFRPDEDQPGKDHVVILSHRSWANRFGADPNIVGKQFRLNGEPFAVVGVMPAGPSDRHDEELWVPLSITPEQQVNRASRVLLVTGRLKAGVAIQQAQGQMNAIAHQIGELYPTSNKNWTVSVEPLQNDFLNPNTRTNLWLLLGAVSFVLLIGCVNVANLLLARGTARQRELAVRTAIGASRRQLIVQLLAESLTLAVVGGILGVLLSGVLLRVILVLLPPGTLSSEANVRLSLPVLLFTLTITVLSGVLFGCVPALQIKHLDLNDSLKQGGRSAISTGGRRLRQSLVTVEFALALTLLAGASVTVHSFVNRTKVDLGIRTDHILTFYLPVPETKLGQPQRAVAFYRELLERIEAVPGVIRVAAATGAPLQGAYFDLPFSIAGKPPSDPSSRPNAGVQMITPSYFETFGAHVDRGRVFTSQDSAESPRVVMINEAFAGKFLDGTDPLSERITLEQLHPGSSAGPPLEWQIVGVFHDIQNGGPLGEPDHPEICVPFAQNPWPQATLAVRTAIHPERITSAITAAVHSLDPNLPLANVKTMQQIAHDRFIGDRFGIALYVLWLQLP